MDRPATIIGRSACPLCQNQAAHVKCRPDKLPYIHCPECGCNLVCRNSVQAGYLMAKARPDKLAAVTRPGQPHRAAQAQGGPAVLVASTTDNDKPASGHPARCDPMAAMAAQLGGWGQLPPVEAAGRRPCPSSQPAAAMQAGRCRPGVA